MAWSSYKYVLAFDKSDQDGCYIATERAIVIIGLFVLDGMLSVGNSSNDIQGVVCKFDIHYKCSKHNVCTTKILETKCVQRIANIEYKARKTNLEEQISIEIGEKLLPENLLMTGTN
jgi:hypothetical protein